jgi:hypothetical protein
LTRKSLQPIVCCLGDDVGGNPTQFALERAFTDRGLSDWKLFSAEIVNEQVGEALSAFELLGIESVLLLTDPLRSLVLGETLPVKAQPLAQWCGRATLLRRLWDEAAVEEKSAEGTEGATVPRRPVWEASYSVGSAILQSILGTGPALANTGNTESAGTSELHCLVSGDSPTARAVVAALVSFETSHIWWRVGESATPLSDRCPLELSEVLQGAIGAERLKISAELPDDTGINYDTIVLGDERWNRELEKWLLREQPGTVRRMVDARSDVFSLSPLKLPIADTIQTIRQTDWLGKILEEDFLRLTGVAPNPAIVRDALDEYLEL